MPHVDSPLIKKEPQEILFCMPDESKIQQLKKQNYCDTQKQSSLVEKKFFLSEKGRDILLNSVSHGVTLTDNSVLSNNDLSNTNRGKLDIVDIEKSHTESIKLIDSITELNEKIRRISSEEEKLLIIVERDNVIEQYFTHIALEDPEQEKYYKITERQSKKKITRPKELTHCNTSHVNQNFHSVKEEPRSMEELQDNVQIKSAIITGYQDNDHVPFIFPEQQGNIIKDRHNSIGRLHKSLEGNTILAVSNQDYGVERVVVDSEYNNYVANIAEINRVVNSAINIRINQGLAASAALTGLFQPFCMGNSIGNISIGGYGASMAIAFGMGYSIDKNIAAKAGVAYSAGNNVMYNASLNLGW